MSPWQGDTHEKGAWPLPPSRRTIDRACTISARLHRVRRCIPRMASATVVHARINFTWSPSTKTFGDGANSAALRWGASLHDQPHRFRPDCRAWYVLVFGHSRHHRGQQTRSACEARPRVRGRLDRLSACAKSAHQPAPAGVVSSDDGPAALVEMCARAPIPPASYAQGWGRGRATGNAEQGGVGVHVTAAAAGSGQVDGSESKPKVNRHRRSTARGAAWRCK